MDSKPTIVIHIDILHEAEIDIQCNNSYTSGIDTKCNNNYKIITA